MQGINILIPYIGNFSRREILAKMTLGRCVKFNWVLILLFQGLSMKTYNRVYFSLSLFLAISGRSRTQRKLNPHEKFRIYGIALNTIKPVLATTSEAKTSCILWHYFAGPILVHVRSNLDNSNMGIWTVIFLSFGKTLKLLICKMHMIGSTQGVFFFSGRTVIVNITKVGS